MRKLIKHLFKKHRPENRGAPIETIQKKADTLGEDASFAKISVTEPPKVKKRGGKLKWVLPMLFLVVVVLSGAVVVWGVLPVKATYKQAQILVVSVKELTQTLKNQDLEGAKAKLPEVRKKVKNVRTSWENAFLIKNMPYLSVYYLDGLHALNAAEYGLDSLDIAISTIEPYSDLLGLKGKSTFVSGSADDRIQLAVKTLDKVTPKISEIGTKIEKLKIEIDAIDPSRYPEALNGQPIRARLVEGKNLLHETAGLFLDAQPLLEVLPQLLGEPKQKRYLVLFQNDKELRPTGGFITAYAIFKIEHGKISVEKSDDIYELDDQIKVKKQAWDEILTFHKGVYYSYTRDSNLSPDFKVSVEDYFEKVYPNKFDFDGVIAVDTHVLVESIKILGTFVVKGRTFSAETDKRCNCPKVIYELEDYSTRPVAYVREDRKDVLGELLKQIMTKALGVSPSQYWGKLFQMGIAEINQKHVLAYMVDENSQKGIESLNMGSRIADGSKILGYKDSQNWDYLHINDANMAGAKSNLFVENYVKQEYQSSADGSIVKTITIDYKNPAPPSDCNLESGGLCLNGLLRNWVRIYVPKGSTLIESKGSQSPKDDSAQNLKVYESLGKTVFEGFLTVRPLGSAQLILKYKLPFKKDGKFMFLMQKQSGTVGHEYTILVNGKQKEKFALTTDKVIELPL